MQVTPAHRVFKESTEVRKIGQYPSAADLAFGSLDAAFNRELEDGWRRELGTAVGLQSHGVGIGSFVYLRRIFEALLEEAHQQALSDSNWSEETGRPESLRGFYSSTTTFQRGSSGRRVSTVFSALVFMSFLKARALKASRW